MRFFIVLWLVSSACCLFGVCSAAKTCEEAASSLIKLDLLKQCIVGARNHYPKCSDTNDAKNCSAKDRSLAHLNVALDLIATEKISCQHCTVEPPMDCSDIWKMGFKRSGVYEIWPKGRGVKTRESINVYCDMDNGGWTVIQRRGQFQSDPVDFYQNWDTYKKGFGDIRKEFWLGNEKIYTLTNQGLYSVRFDLMDKDKEYRYAEYNYFYIGDEYSGYVLHVQNHTGNATDDVKHHNGMMFSTFDRQNDRRDANNSCAINYRAAFWYAANCGYVNLNGVNQPGVSSHSSIWWYKWKKYEGLYSVEVKIRRNYE